MMYKILDLKSIKENNSYNIGKISPFEAGIPLVELSDKTIEEIYYFRWHTFCKHIKTTDNGYVITEFFPLVPWAGKYNTISCPAAHHHYEGRWLYDKKYLNSYSEFWFTPEAEPRKYSFWAANSIYAAALVSGDFSVAEALYSKLKENFQKWEEEKGYKENIYYQIDNYDGMEFSIGGSGIRPTINSYMYGDAKALQKIAERLSLNEDAEYFKGKAENIKNNINEILWDEEAEFFKTLNIKTNTLVDVRELVGYIPWYFNIPDDKKTAAWKFLNDKNHFYAPYGPTSAEQCHTDFMKEFNHECLWNGPSWPFATSQTLTALGNLICDYNQDIMNKTDYYKLLHLYANCHYLTENGETVPFIDENLDPFTGEWLARKILKSGFKPDSPDERGKDYNHSTYCDLVLSGLAGIRSSNENKITVEPLFTADDLEYFCADGILIRDKYICVLWDKNGKKYNLGKSFKIFVNGEEVFSADTPCKYEIKTEE